MNFDLYLPFRLITGRGCVRRNGEFFSAMGKQCLIVTSGSAGRKSGALDDVEAVLREQGIGYKIHDKVQQNPLLIDSWEAGKLAREIGADFLVGIGGGSPQDATKAVAVYAANEMADPMEIYKRDWKRPALPMILIGTTAGTGSEVTPFAVMTTPEGKKKSFGRDDTYGTITFGDPKYTDTLPLRFTVSTALDALSHALEGYFSTIANELSDVFAIKAVGMLIPMLRVLQGLGDGDKIPEEVRDGLYYASVTAGLELARCGTCYCHSLGYFLTEEHGVAHGTACAVFLPGFVRRAARLMPERAEALQKGTGFSVGEICALIEGLNEVPAVKLTPEKIGQIVGEYTGSSNFLRTAPDGLSDAEAAEILTGVFG